MSFIKQKQVATEYVASNKKPNTIIWDQGGITWDQSGIYWDRTFNVSVKQASTTYVKQKGG